ncbi:MAG: response regulator [Fibrobacter sp.]|nr:response regulator [Fibrobacter sp.]
MGYSVLIVDDSATVRSSMARVFDMANLPLADLFEAENGLEALDVLQENWVDIVLADINMPKMNGIELVRSMKSNPELRNIPIAIVSTEGSQGRIAELREAGIAGYLRKPCRPEELKNLLVEVLGEWQ